MARPDVSVVICAYSDRRWNDLVAAVTSVRAQSEEPAEIVVVVDHNPALLTRARAALPVSTVVENGEPRGLSGARNSGISATSGEVVAFLDDDAIAEPTWLECLIASTRIDGSWASAVRLCRRGMEAARGRSPTSSIGWSAVPTGACLRRPRPCATSSAATCRSAVVYSVRWVGSAPAPGASDRAL